MSLHGKCTILNLLSEYLTLSFASSKLLGARCFRTRQKVKFGLSLQSAYLYNFLYLVKSHFVPATRHNGGPEACIR